MKIGKHYFAVIALGLLLPMGCNASQPKQAAPTGGPPAAQGSSAPASAPTVAAPQPKASPTPPELPGDEQPLRAVQFVSTRVGWAGGLGVILKTTDGGQTWVRRAIGPRSVQALSFADDRHGWAATQDALLRTTDGGDTWAPAGEPLSPLQSVDFTDPSHGWGVTSDEHLFATADGGDSWVAATLPGPVQTTCFTSAATGWAGGGARVFRTTDGGKNWRPVFTAPVTGSEHWRATVRCSGTDMAWALFRGGAAMSQQAYVVFATFDAGAHWTPMLEEAMFSTAYPDVKVDQVIDAYSGPFVVPGPHSAIFLGECPACYGWGTVSITRSDDGGKSWSHQAVDGLRSGEFGLAFPDGQHGWLAVTQGRKGGIFATGDGGRTWTLQYPRP